MPSAYKEIQKDLDSLKKKPNLFDYAAECRNWSWERVWKYVDRLGGLVSLAHVCIDRHANGANAEKPALVWQGADLSTERYTYTQMKVESNKFANVLREVGVSKGDRVFFLTECIPELYFAVFGTLKRGAIVVPLFSAFGPEPIRERVQRAEGSVIITTPKLLRKVNKVRGKLPSLKHVIVIAHRTCANVDDPDLEYLKLMEEASEDYSIENTGLDDPSVIHFTSGTTGLPKGAVHVHGAVVAHYATGKYVLDLHEDDIYWCTADPGWVTGTSYGMFAPWSVGVTNVIYEGGFGAKLWYEVIQRHRVSVWYTAPTAIRLLMRAGTRLSRRYDLSSLRHIMSVGEPLNPEAIVWGQDAFGLPIHDNWWQTETGAIMIANYISVPIRPGSMGQPFPGIRLAILDTNLNEITEPMMEGQLALKPGWPSMFRTYWNERERYDSRFKKGWYLTGDTVKRDADGYLWFVGREDDVINTAGHLVSPFEVENVLIEHPAVAEAGVIAKPDPVAMEVVKAFVTLNEGCEPSDELRREIYVHGRERLGLAIAPREIDIIDVLPKTRSGKIMRRVLKARELGLPEGDTSTLEEG